MLQVLAAQRRRQILALIWDDEMAVSDIATHVEVSVAAVSQHLARLKSAGLVVVRPEGKRRLYRAEREAFREFAPLLEMMWRGDFDRLAAVVEETRLDR